MFRLMESKEFEVFLTSLNNQEVCKDFMTQIISLLNSFTSCQIFKAKELEQTRVVCSFEETKFFVTFRKTMNNNFMTSVIIR